jgi:hypothetical protein
MKFQDVITKTVQILEAPGDPMDLSADPMAEPASVDPAAEFSAGPETALPGEEEIDVSNINEGKLALIELARKAFLAGLYYTSSDVNDMFQEPGDYGIVTTSVDHDNMLDIQGILNYLVRDFYPDTDID